MLKSAFDEIISGYNVKWIVHPGDSYKDKSVGHFSMISIPITKSSITTNTKRLVKLLFGHSSNKESINNNIVFYHHWHWEINNPTSKIFVEAIPRVFIKVIYNLLKRIAFCWQTIIRNIIMTKSIFAKRNTQKMGVRINGTLEILFKIEGSGISEGLKYMCRG